MSMPNENDDVNEILKQERELELYKRQGNLLARLSDLNQESNDAWNFFMNTWKSMNIIDLTAHINSMEAMRKERMTIDRILEKMQTENPSLIPF